MVLGRRTAVILLVLLIAIPSVASVGFAMGESDLAGLFQALMAIGAAFGIITLYRSFGYPVVTAFLMAVLSVPVLLFLLIVLSIVSNCMVNGCYI